MVTSSAAEGGRSGIEQDLVTVRENCQKENLLDSNRPAILPDHSGNQCESVKIDTSTISQ
jgi:hypothetical protein